MATAIAIFALSFIVGYVCYSCGYNDGKRKEAEKQWQYFFNDKPIPMEHHHGE